MSSRCHLYAVVADQIEPMKTHPALVLGRGILTGMASCHLENPAEAFQEVLFGTNHDRNESSGFLLEGGFRLESAGVTTTNSRLLMPRDVQAFNKVLQSLTEAELFRRFNNLALMAAGVDALQLLESSWQESTEESWDGDWTLDQAEEYETLAQDFERLRTFIAESTHRGWGVVVAENREKL